MAQDKTLIDTLQRVQSHTDTGITLIQGSHDEQILRYRDLYTRARRVLYVLQQKGLRPRQELVLQVQEEQVFLHVFWACVLGGIVPVPCTVGINEEHRLKLVQIWSVLQEPVLVAEAESWERFVTQMDVQPAVREMEESLVRTDELMKAAENPDSPLGEVNAATQEDIAFIQFSSGSTGDPKGVVLTHANVVSNLGAIAAGVQGDTSDSVLSWMPLTHDTGLIGMHLMALYAGLPFYLIPTNLFVRRPSLWLAKVSEHRVTLTSSPNFGYKLFLTTFKPKRSAEWDLSALRVIFNGAEPISYELCNRFLDELAPYGLQRTAMFPVYGLAEATVGAAFPMPGDVMCQVRVDRRTLVLGGRVEELGDEKSRVYEASFLDVGTPIRDVEIRICGEGGDRLDEMQVGYIQIRGKSVTQGYYNNPEATQRVRTGDGWLNTGDLGFQREGRLVVTGRAKDILFVNGQNVYPHDVERIAEVVEGVELGKVAVTGVFDPTLQRDLILVFVTYKHGVREFAPLALQVTRCISRQMGLQVDHVLPVRAIAKTTSGKVQRYKLGELYQSGEFDVIAADLQAFIRELVQSEAVIPPRNDVEATILQLWQEVLLRESISVEDNFFELGGTSTLVAQIVGQLEGIYPDHVRISDPYALPTIRQMADHILAKLNTISQKPEQFPVGIHTSAQQRSRDIAVIGMSLRVPMADSVEAFWQNIREGVGSTRSFPTERRRFADRFLDYLGKPQDRTYIAGGYLEGIEQFDPAFFRMLPTEASLMSPDQRLFLECAWEALEDAGYGGQRAVGTRTGVYVGYVGDLAGFNYRQLIDELDVDPLLRPASVPGNLSGIVASGISYLLDLKGPAMLIDTACSSSLVAVHQACAAIRNGDCEMALAGGVRLNLIPLEQESTKVGIDSSDGKTRAFDNRSDGTAMGEGVGCVFLKPLEQALQDGDPVYAVIKGSAVNQDGQSAGITFPNAQAQTDVLVRAWQDANIDPSTLSYVEAHGTGTKIGDPIELDALTRAFGRYTDRRQFVAIGSLKSNIGHTYQTAGVVGLIKAALALHHQELPPTLHVQEPNRQIKFVETPFYVNSRRRAWPDGEHPRRCGVSSFGFSGTNAHVVLEEAPLREKAPERRVPQLLALSAMTPESLRRLAQRYVETLSGSEATWEGICYTAGLGRAHFSHRLAVVALDKAEAVSTLRNWLESGKCVPSEAELQDIAAAYMRGEQVEFQSLFARAGIDFVHLPTYPFDRVRCWVEVPEARVSAWNEVAVTTEEMPRQLLPPSKQIVLTGREDNTYTFIERQLAEVCHRVLGLVEINIQDSFFEMGGNSILLQTVFGHLQNLFPGQVKLTDLFAHTSISRLAQRLTHQPPLQELFILEETPELSTADLHRLLDEIDAGSCTIEQALAFLREN